jgi:hypothetical protein
MSDTPRLSPHKEAERAARDERRARALRDNLYRRKEQARARTQPGEGDVESAAASLSEGPPSGKSGSDAGTT